MKKLSFNNKPLHVFFLFTAFLASAFITKTYGQVTFSVTASVNNNVNTGSFTSSGMNMSSGDFIEEYAFNGKKVHSVVTFIYADGTITAKTHSDVTLTGSSTASGTGTWQITNGTGAYNNLKGTGNLTYTVRGIGTPNERISQEWDGSIK